MESFIIEVELSGSSYRFFVEKFLNDVDNRIDYKIYQNNRLVYILYPDLDDFGTIWCSLQPCKQELIDLIGEMIERFEM